MDIFSTVSAHTLKNSTELDEQNILFTKPGAKLIIAGYVPVLGTNSV